MALRSAGRRRKLSPGLADAQIAELREVVSVTEDLDGAYLGATALNDTTVRLDINANGYGWYVDATPGDDNEFANAKSATRLYTTPDQVPAGRMDLLTVLMHELGHVIDLDSSFSEADRDDLMYAYLTTGERRLPAVKAHRVGDGLQEAARTKTSAAAPKE